MKFIIILTISILFFVGILFVVESFEYMHN